jgi:hypothetical protein
MIRHGLKVVAAVAVLGVAGCGGDDDSNKTLSYSDFSNQANEICKKADEGTAGLKITGDPANDADVFDKAVPQVESAIEDFGKLKPPEELKSAYDQFVSLANEQLANTKKAQAAAKAGDKQGEIQALKANAPLDAQSKAAGSKLGAAECAK